MRIFPKFNRHRLLKLANPLYIQFAKLYLNKDDDILFSSILKNELVPNIQYLKMVMVVYNLNIEDIEKTALKYFLCDSKIFNSIESSDTSNLDILQFDEIKYKFINILENTLNENFGHSANELYNLFCPLFLIDEKD